MNHNPTNDEQLWLATPARDLDAYDKLPPAVRAKLQEAPYNMAAEYAVEVGPAAFLVEYERDHGGYRPPQRRR